MFEPVALGVELLQSSLDSTALSFQGCGSTGFIGLILASALAFCAIRLALVLKLISVSVSVSVSCVLPSTTTTRLPPYEIGREINNTETWSANLHMTEAR